MPNGSETTAAGTLEPDTVRSRSQQQETAPAEDPEHTQTHTESHRGRRAAPGTFCKHGARPAAAFEHESQRGKTGAQSCSGFLK